ncbi:MAG: hypothetical protein K9L21_04485, partial [Spirochaetia bacterium]|nr:hypothetical protein [Spirochaetia bacterium]
MKTVFTRIIIAMLMLSCLMLLVQGGINYGYQLASLEKWHKDIADEFESKLLYMINKAELFPLDASSYSLQALVEKALEDDRILRAVMYNTDGKELFSLSSIISRESEKPHNFMGNIQVMQSFSQKDTSFPIHIDESQIGYLTITTLAPSRYDITRNFFNKTIWIFLISLPVSLLSAVAVSFILSRRLASVPIKLSREISSLAKGNRSVQFSKSNIYEFSLISDAASILQQELLKSQRSRTQFMSNLAHDLRTPVAAMNVQIEGVLEGVFPPSKQVFSHLQTQLTLLHEKIDAFLKISHLESPDYVIKPIRVNLGKTVES